MPKDLLNYYEINRNLYKEVKEVFLLSDAATALDNVGIVELVLSFIQPYVIYSNPYAREMENVYNMSRQMYRLSRINTSIFYRIPSFAINNITEFLLPYIIVSEAIPCAITTIAYINNFNYNQKDLFDNARAEGNILSIRNSHGVIESKTIHIENKIEEIVKNKHGRPSKKKEPKLFGTGCQTTFLVNTPYRPDKTFSVKLFQGKTVKSETLGVLFVDCRDAIDVNNTIVNELKRALNMPDIKIDEFKAMMRNYRFRLLPSVKGHVYNIRISKMDEIIYNLHETTHPHITCNVNINKYPSAIIEIQLENHPSKKGKIIIKVFQSGKLNLDSVIHREHICVWYRFINEFFIKYASSILYIPATAEDEYDSEHYYELEGVKPPPADLI